MNLAGRKRGVRTANGSCGLWLKRFFIWGTLTSILSLREGEEEMGEHKNSNDLNRRDVKVGLT